jgi:hypothetical protein
VSIRSPGIFGILPQLFFSPLASPNRAHYAALLVIYYRAFQESPHGVERKALVARFAEYLEANALSFTEGDEPQEQAEVDGEVGENGAQSEPDDAEADGQEAELFDTVDTLSIEPARAIASRCIRILTAAGWMSEETLPDYTRVVNMTPYARPFLEALARVDEGLKVEYESHVVSIYSLLCGDAAKENGHYLVLNAHAQTLALIDSLKVLSQGIREHYEKLTDGGDGKTIAEILALHYDGYAPDILDGAYKRLKTSDNLSKYRPKIIAQVRDFLEDREWLEASSVKYARTGSITVASAREKLVAMLEEIRDTLRAVDPLLDEIDRRNMLYAKSSVERVKTLLEPPSTIAGRIMRAATALREHPGVYRKLPHHLYRVRAITEESRYRRWLKEALEPESNASVTDSAELERAESELRLRLARQLGPGKIAAWLDGSGGSSRPLPARDLARDTDGFVRVLYAALYADSRPEGFAYFLEEGEAFVETESGWRIPDMTFRRKP